MSDRWATFDCYGTLVDWMSGIRSTLARLFPKADSIALLDLYMQIEPTVQEGRGIAYRQMMAETLGALAVTKGLPHFPADRDALADSLPTWPVFPDVPGALRELRERGWKLAILSNTDPDLLAASIEAIWSPVDATVVASEIGSYKPAFGHWDAFFRETGASRERHVHVAASIFHDIEPCAKLGLPAVWINRMGETSALPRAVTLTDLSGLPDALDSLIPVGAG